MLRHFVKPGITGLSQIRGLRGETRQPSEMQERVKTDVYYIENWSLLLDLKVIANTILNTIKGDAAP
ncbi:MAG: sugar transferase [Owenweeksia sp.]|nr:sugar transferase [Owenweeksia sp.]